MLSLVADFQQNKPLALNPQFVHGIRCILSDSTLDKVIHFLLLLRIHVISKEEKEIVRMLHSVYS